VDEKEPLNWLTKILADAGVLKGRGLKSRGNRRENQLRF
jgi:hypothetical protein